MRINVETTVTVTMSADELECLIDTLNAAIASYQNQLGSVEYLKLVTFKNLLDEI